MALKVRDAQPFGDLVVSNSPQQKLVVQSAPPQQLSIARNGPQQALAVSRAPMRMPTITGVTGASPGLSRPVRPMDDPVKWFFDTVKSFGKGVADTLDPVPAFTQLGEGLGQALGQNSPDVLAAQEAQRKAQEQNLQIILEGQRRLSDPNTSDKEKAQWKRLIGVVQRQELGQFQDAQSANQTLIDATDPVTGAANTVAVGAMLGEGKAIAGGINDIIAAASKSGVKKEALNYLLRQELVGRKNIPVTKTGGGDIPIPVSVSKTIPVRYSPSDDVLDARLSKEVDIISGRHENELAQAGKSDAPLLNAMGTDTKYNAKYDELLAQREAGTLPQRIEVKDAPKPKVRQKGILETKLDDAQGIRKKSEVSLKEKPSPVDHYIPDREYGKSPNVFTRAWRSVAGVLEKNGTGGKAINRGVQNARDYAEKATGNYMTDLEQAGFKHIDDARFARVWDAVESGSAKGLDNDERRLAAALIRTMQRIHKSATDEAAMDIGDRGSTYLPRWYKEGDKDMANFFKRNFNQRNSNLENKRLTDEEGYEKTKEAIARYVQNATDRIGRAKEFGQGDEKLKAMFEVAAREGYDIKQLERYAKTALGDTDMDTTGHKISGAIRQYEAITSLQKSAAANIGQQVNTITVTGVRNWAKATYKYWTDPNARDWAKRTGVFGDHVLGNLQKQYAGSVGDNMTGNKAVQIFKKHFLVPGMQAVEKFNRANAVLAGKGFAEDLLKKSAKGDKQAQRLLKRYFPTLKNGDTITDEMITDAAREVVKRTQFKVDPVDLPNWTNGALGKLIFQFRSFGYKQTQFMAREVIGEALRGNFSPMIRFLAIGSPAGYAIYEGRNAISGTFMDEEKRKEFADKSIGQRVLDGFSQIGAFGLPGSEATNIKRSVDYADDGNKVLDAATSTLGPAITDARRLGDAVNDGVTKGEWRNGAIFAAQQVPILGPIVSGLVKDGMKGETDITKMNPDELDKFKKTTYAKFTGEMSDRDKDLMEAVSDDDYARLGIKGGKFTQDEVDDMQARYNRELFSKGLPVRYIKGVTDEEFETFSDELKGLVLEASMVGIKKFAESDKYDKTAEAVMKKAMESAWPEIGDIKGNNQLAIDYLKAQRDYTEAEKNGDDGKKFDIVKGYWNKAVKQQYPEKVRNLYNNSLADIKRLYEGITVNGVKYEISRADMDAAVALDDRLLSAGLTDTPKFSNKTRKEFGYGEAPISKVDGVGYAGKKTSSSGSGGGGSGSSASANPYRYALKRGSRSNLSGANKASTSGGKASVKLAGATSGGGVAKPKVSIKKNKV